MDDESVVRQLEQLVTSFQRDVEFALEMDSPNAQDDLALKMAIVGFSYNSDTGDWDLGHFDFVKERVASAFSTNEMRKYGPNADNVRLFFALSIGYLLGLYNKGTLTDDEFRRAEIQSSGVIMLHLGRLTGRAATETKKGTKDVGDNANQ